MSMETEIQLFSSRESPRRYAQLLNLSLESYIFMPFSA
ncbi:hypothetical protein T06_9496 [Trichinella sp. T6]|nr:hypothetical protein T06_9496 [Trichinella sp. T6]